jgi:hypothetical protein
MDIYAVVHKNALGAIIKVQTIQAKTVTEAAYWFGFNFEGHLSDNMNTDAPFVIMVTQAGGHSVYLYPTSSLVTGVATSGYL